MEKVTINKNGITFYEKKRKYNEILLFPVSENQSLFFVYDEEQCLWFSRLVYYSPYQKCDLLETSDKRLLDCVLITLTYLTDYGYLKEGLKMKNAYMMAKYISYFNDWLEFFKDYYYYSWGDVPYIENWRRAVYRTYYKK